MKDNQTEGQIAIEKLNYIEERKLKTKNNTRWFMLGVLTTFLMGLAFVGLITLAALLQLLLEAGY